MPTRKQHLGIVPIPPKKSPLPIPPRKTPSVRDRITHILPFSRKKTPLKKKRKFPNPSSPFLKAPLQLIILSI
jgi:hypothetical protein